MPPAMTTVAPRSASQAGKSPGWWGGASTSSRATIFFSAGSASTRAKCPQWPKCRHNRPSARGMAIFIYLSSLSFRARAAAVRSSASCCAAMGSRMLRMIFAVALAA